MPVKPETAEIVQQAVIVVNLLYNRRDRAEKDALSPALFPEEEAL